jgi:YebC/PmpR family DNA-binding regulatory protein
MSGHSKWSTIKRKKGAVDAKRGRLFTKLTKEITVSARMGGGDPDGNPRLRLAIQAAKAAAMPNDNIQRAIKKGTGEIEGAAIEELVYEAYGPGGVAFIMDVTTDNQNRTIAEVRSIFDKYGGNVAKTGAVAFIFSRVGMLRFDAARHGEDQVMEAALEAGAEDVRVEDGQVVVYTGHHAFPDVKERMEKAGLEPALAEITMIPSTTVACDEDLARKTLALLDRLEDHDDIANVWGNFDIPDAVMERIQDA